MNMTIADMLTANRAELDEACERFGVARLDLFGSAATESFDSGRSDLDFLVEFKPEARRRAFDNYFGLRDRLIALFGRPVDLLTTGSLRNPYLIREIERSRRLLYASHA